jgi:gliding motility-associated-like protein
MNSYVKKLFFLILFFTPVLSFATHIVGGEVYYKKLTGNNYEIKLIVYRDCQNGVPPFDDPASIGFFDAGTNVLVSDLFVSTADSVDVPDAVNNPCFVAPVNICYKKATYTFTVNLPPNSNGYLISYQRCCRNNSISNILQPGATGASYVASIPGSAFPINTANPVYTNFPPTYICLGFPLVFDHSATDADGDSLVYELCTPLDGGTVADPLPQPPNNPPYQAITFNSPPYSVTNMLNGLPGGAPLAINSQTGQLTATPTTLGQFVVGVCVREYRNGIYLSTTRRDFQFNVILCPSLLVADFNAQTNSIITLCGSFVANFVNNSFGASTYQWNFGDPTSVNDTSTAFAPSYIYPDTGVYPITLIAFSNFGVGCADTTTGFVYVRPALTSDFTSSTVPCSFSVQFNDFITNSSGIAASVNYNFGDNSSSSQNDPLHTFPGQGVYTVTLITTSVDGCTDTVQKTVTIPATLTSITSSSSVKCFADCSGTASVTAVSGPLPYTYLWSNGLTTDSIANLCQGTYTVTVTDSAGCAVVKSITINQPDSISFTANATDDYCGAICIGTANAIATGGTPPFFYIWNNGTTTEGITNLCQGNYTVTVTDNNGCTSNIASVNVGLQNFFPALSVSANPDTIFEGQTVQLTSTTNSGYTYTWTPSNSLSNASIANPTSTPLESTTFFLTINDSLSCPVSDSVKIYVRQVICLEPYVFVPNAFTPNDDKNNDIFRVRGDQIKELLLRVYDRWGEKVFETTTPGKGWDGTYKGKKVTPGVFVYYMEAVCFDNEKFFKKGNVTVIR